MCHLITEPRWKWRPSSSQKVWDLSLAGGVAEMLSLKLKLKLIITHVSNQSAKILPKRENVCNTGFQMLPNDFVYLSILQYVGCLSNVGNFLNLISVNYWINFILQQMVCLVGKWMSELYTWQNCIVWCKKCVENLEHDFEFLCKKWLLHGQLKLNCIKRDKVMQWKVRFKTSLFTSPKRLYLKNMKFFVQFGVLNIGYCQHKRFWHTLTKKFRIV